jgi:hypothetical protein
MGDRAEAQAVWDDLESALGERGYQVTFGGNKRNHGGAGYRLYGEIRS